MYYLPLARGSCNSCQYEWRSRDATRKTRHFNHTPRNQQPPTHCQLSATWLAGGAAQSPALLDVLLMLLQADPVQEHPHLFSIQQGIIDLGVSCLHEQYQVTGLEAAS